MTSDEEKKGEVRVVFLGPIHKTVLFEKLCKAAKKFEKHVHYDDTFYLTVSTSDHDRVIQFTDPGLAKTGGREMAIRCADVAVLVYSAGCGNSLEELRALKDDFERKKHLPIRLICDVDENFEEEEDSGSTGISSVSEGYESDPDREHRFRRHPSMEKIRKVTEDFPAAEEAGKQLASEFGDLCKFLLLNSSTFNDAEPFLLDLLESTRTRKKNRSRSLIPKLKHKSKDSSPVSKDPSTNGSEDDVPKRKNSEVKESRVCSIM